MLLLQKYFTNILVKLSNVSADADYIKQYLLQLEDDLH